ncbi:MAG: polyisoprenoid-binding protein YceI [Candidatus Azotimanducaceae bacterium]|jgi:polyisoprenoid-binding protein YceI
MEKKITMKKLFKIMLLGFFVLSVQAQAADYVIDTRGAHAGIQFKFKHIGISWLVGRFNTFEGEFSFDEKDIANTRIVVDIDVTSLDSNHAERDKHLRSSDFLDVSKHPTAKFVSTRIVDHGEGNVTVFGNFTMMGVTKEIAIESSMVGMGKDPWGGYRAGFEGTTTLNTKDFNLTMPPTNQVELALYIEGVRK